MTARKSPGRKVAEALAKEYDFTAEQTNVIAERVGLAIASEAAKCAGLVKRDSISRVANSVLRMRARLLRQAAKRETEGM